jgi:hypothetical protein
VITEIICPLDIVGAGAGAGWGGWEENKRARGIWEGHVMERMDPDSSRTLTESKTQRLRGKVAASKDEIEKEWSSF